MPSDVESLNHARAPKLYFRVVMTLRLGGLRLKYAAYSHGSFERQSRQEAHQPSVSPWPKTERGLTNLSRLSRLAGQLNIEVGATSDDGAAGRAAIWRTLSIWVGSDNRGGMYEEILEHGQSFSSRPFEASPNWGRSSSPFDNAASTLAAGGAGARSLWYVEGLAAAPGAMFIPLHHAWLVDELGVVIETTWRDSASASYFGIKFSTEFVLQRHRKLRGHWSPLLEKPSGS
jgi:hypothetical protein